MLADRAFTQEDPIGIAGGLNLYGYANGDPVNFSDPFGLCPGCLGIGVPGIAEALVESALTDFHSPTGGGVRGCDAFGCGDFGASRGGRVHAGTDFAGQAGQDVAAVRGGRITRVGRPYAGGTDAGTLQLIEIQSGDYMIKQFYSELAEGVSVGDFVFGGQPIGMLQTLQNRYPSITDHVHVEIRLGLKVLNPEDLIGGGN